MIPNDPELDELKRQAVLLNIELKQAKARKDLELIAKLKKDLRRLAAIIVECDRARDRGCH